MTDTNHTLALLALMCLATTPVAAQHKTPTESQCREMVNGMLQTMKSAPMETERDKKGSKEIIERAEKIVRENRARGASECESWAAIGRLVVHQ